MPGPVRAGNREQPGLWSACLPRHSASWQAKSADVKSRLVLHTSASILGLPGYEADAGAAMEDGEADFTGERACL